MANRIETTWGAANLSGVLPDNGKAVIDSIAEVVSALTTIIEALQVTLELVAGVLLTPVDVLSALLQTALDALDALIEGILGTAISMTWFVPSSYKKAPTLSESIGLLADSMTDQYDPQRPFGESPDNHFAMWTIFAVAPSIKELFDRFKELSRLFDLPFIYNVTEAPSYYERFFQSVPQGAPASPQAAAPNWQKGGLGEVGVIGDFVQAVARLRKMLAVPASNVRQIRKVLELVIARLEQISGVAKQLVQLVADLAAFAALRTGFYALQLTGQGSVVQQQAILRASAAAPDFPLSGVDRLSASAFISLHTQAATGAGIAVFKTIFGVSELSASDVVSPETKSAWRKAKEFDKNTTAPAAAEQFRRKWGQT